MNGVFTLILFLPLVMAVVGVLMIVIGRLGQDVMNRDGGHSRRYADFMRERRLGGVSYEDAQSELYMREQLARVRREASDAVAANPAGWLDAIHKAKADAVERCAADRPDLAPSFAPWLGGIGYHEVLYPDEVRMAEAQMLGRTHGSICQDRYAALKVLH